MEPIGKVGKMLSSRQKVEVEFYNSFKVFVWVCQVFCTAPVCSELFKKQDTPRRIRDALCSVVHMIFGFALCGCVCYATYLQFQEHDGAMGFLTEILYTGEYFIGTFNLLLVIVGCQYQKKYYAIFYQRLVDIDISMQKCGIQPNHASTKLYLKRSMTIYIIFFAGVIVIDFMYNSMHAESFVSSSTVYTIPNIVSTLALTQYATVLHYIREKFRSINRLLEKIVLNSNFINRQNGLIISVIAMDVRKNSNFTSVLDILRKQHAELTRLIALLNQCFGLLILLIMVAAYIILSTQFYAFYKMTEGFEATDIWLTIYTVFWVILHSGKILLILCPINDVCDERKRTGNILFEMNLADDKNWNMIKTFADQLLHENSPPNAMRIVNLDLTLVGTMIGVLTTYLIILIQFDASARDKSKESV